MSVDFDKMSASNIREYLENLTSHFEDDLKKFNEFLLKKEELEEIDMRENDKFKYLYPHHLNPRFNLRIANKKEFQDLKYPKEKRNVEKVSNQLCNAEFELSPHQIFVRNFLSSYTPYNTLLLYHGLGTGKTCSAISVCEEYREYMNQSGIDKRIIIVASPNVQENFKLQLFDPSRLKLINGMWNIHTCTGNKFIKEINPMNMAGLKKNAIIRQIKTIIRQHYLFMGYEMFANYIERIMNKYTSKDDSKETEITKKKRALDREFSNRLIVIDEVHNIIPDTVSDRDDSSQSKETKKISKNIMKMVKNSENVKMLLLSATPMFNSYREIIWLINLMNTNDNRPTIKKSDIFDKRGNFKIINNREYGKELFIRKTRGYISFVRSENPYTFPYRIYPKMFDVKHSILSDDYTYPERQINNVNIIQGIEFTDLFLNSIGNYQRYGYSAIIDKLNKNFPNVEQIESGGMGWIQTEPALQALNFIYPHKDIGRYKYLVEQNEINDDFIVSLNPRNYIGIKGLKNCMNYKNKSNFEYKEEIREKYGEFFSPEHIVQYSAKIHSIMNKILSSKGVVLIYSQYIDGGCVPVALALEHIGITRYGNKNLFKTKRTDNIDALTLTSDNVKHPAKYIMITGDILLSPDNNNELKAVTSLDNVDGKNVKVVIISKAGSEGIDFKFIRQVHVLDPWYNLSREEQIIGRAVRYCSHKDLPFSERNVEIYLHTTRQVNEREAIDMYIYRIAERKAIKIGVVSRLMKENAVDCILNKNLNQLPVDKINEDVELTLSSNKTITFSVGDKAKTHLCDYLDRCKYKCMPRGLELDMDTLDMNTYNEDFIKINVDKIILKIKRLFRESFVYDKENLIRELSKIRNYPLIQINTALDKLVNDPYEYVSDTFGRIGRVVNVDTYYLFQPIEITDKRITRYSRSVPIDYKREKMNISLPEQIKEHIVSHKPKAKKKIILKLMEEREDIVDSITTSGMNMVREMKKQLEVVNETEEIQRGDLDWFKHTSLAIHNILENLNPENITRNKLLDYVLYHMIDSLTFDKKKTLIEYLLNKTPDNFEKKIKKYIERELLIKNQDLRAYLLYDEKKQVLLKEERRKKKIVLIEVEPTERINLQNIINKKKKYTIEDYSEIVGFMDYIKGSIVFKVKDMKRKRHTGARCDQAGKSANITLLNRILSLDDTIDFTYTTTNTKELRLPALCSIQELLLRHYNYQNTNDNTWFLTLESAMLNDIQSIKIS